MCISRIQARKMLRQKERIRLEKEMKDWNAFIENLSTIDVENYYGLSQDVIDLAYEEAEKKVVSIADTIKLIQDRLMTMLGWLSAAEISLVGVLVGIVSSGSPSPISLWLVSYGVVALGAILIYMVSSGLYGTPVIVSGDEPSHFLDPEIVDQLKKAENKELQIYYIKAWYLRGLQKAITINRRTNMRLVRVHRTVMWSILCAAVLGVILLLVLA